MHAEYIGHETVRMRLACACFADHMEHSWPVMSQKSPLPSCTAFSRRVSRPARLISSCVPSPNPTSQISGMLNGPLWSCISASDQTKSDYFVVYSIIQVPNPKQHYNVYLVSQEGFAQCCACQ